MLFILSLLSWLGSFSLFFACCERCSAHSQCLAVPPTCDMAQGACPYCIPCKCSNQSSFLAGNVLFPDETCSLQLLGELLEYSQGTLGYCHFLLQHSFLFLTSSFIHKSELPPILRNTDSKKSLCKKLLEQGGDGCLHPVSLADVRLDFTCWLGRMQGKGFSWHLPVCHGGFRYHYPNSVTNKDTRINQPELLSSK